MSQVQAAFHSDPVEQASLVRPQAGTGVTAGPVLRPHSGNNFNEATRPASGNSTTSAAIPRQSPPGPNSATTDASTSSGAAATLAQGSSLSQPLGHGVPVAAPIVNAATASASGATPRAAA